MSNGCVRDISGHFHAVCDVCNYKYVYFEPRHNSMCSLFIKGANRKKKKCIIEHNYEF